MKMDISRKTRFDSLPNQISLYAVAKTTITMYVRSNGHSLNLWLDLEVL